MTLGQSWKQEKPAGQFDAIVIGSGMGALTAAALLARDGNKRVLVLEQHYRIGGYTHTFTRPGYEWDVGVHYVGQVGRHGVLRGAFDHLTDGRLKWAKLPEVYDRIELGDRAFDIVSGAKGFVERMCAYFPEESRAIERYVALVKSVGAQSAAHFLARGTGGVMGALASPLSWRFLAYAKRTTTEVLSTLTSNEELRAVLTGQFGDCGLPPGRSSWAMHAALTNHYLGGGYYPVGGSAAIAQSIAPLITERGGHLATCARVEQVIVEKGCAVGVRLDDGSEVRAPLVVSDAGATNTLRNLVPPEARPAAWVRALDTVTRSMGYFGLYLGFKHTDHELGLTGTNLWLYPSHRHDENVERYEADTNAPLPVVYLSFPSAKDPDWARRFPGRATVDVITMAKFDWYSQWQDTRWQNRGDDYEAKKHEMTRRLLESVYRRLPQLRGKVDVVEASTPLSTAHFSGHARGELYGLDHSPARYSLPFRPKTPVKGLYLTGTDISTCGVAGALLSGVMTASSILGARLIPKVFAPRRR